VFDVVRGKIKMEARKLKRRKEGVRREKFISVRSEVLPSGRV